MFPIQGGNSAVAPTYVDDVFASALYTGNGAPRTIQNSLDLSGKGGLVWIKQRSAIAAHTLWDTARGAGIYLQANSTAAQTTNTDGVQNFSSIGFFLWFGAITNTSGAQYASWSFRKAPKFFDVVTYTGNGITNDISHNLGVVPGFVLIKSLSTSTDWFVAARASDTDARLWTNASTGLNTTAGSTNSGASMTTFGFSATTLSLASWPTLANTNGTTYVAYLFAHDASTTGLIQCGSFTTDGSGNASVTSLGWEPQFLMVKASSTTGDWIMLDSLRGWNLTTADALLRANLTNAETTSTEYGNPTATGFDFKGGSSSTTYIYMAIRRPNKPPTAGTSVFALNTATTSGTPMAAPVNNVDLAILANRAGDAKNFQFADRVRGFQVSTTSVADSFTTPTLVTSGMAVESVASNAIYQRDGSGIDGEAVSFSTSGSASRVWYAFKRAPGFFDVVGYTGNGTTNTVNHNLGVAPNLVIIKNRLVAALWDVWTSADWTKLLFLNLDGSGQSSGSRFSQNPSETALYLNAATSDHNDPSNKYIAYLFATLPGISKVGTFTGNGGTQTIDCGFTTGARFILIKRTNATGNWYVWDTARGVVAGNDPYLALNTTAAEVTTDDSVDTDTSGFIVNQVAATNINVSAATYLYLAIA